MKTLTICYITKGTFQMQIHALYQKNMQRIHTSLWKQVSLKLLEVSLFLPKVLIDLIYFA